MPATKITDLLPIPEGTRQPHAYQVFGLENGEQDVRKIADAVKLTITRLKASKDSTDAKLWAKAAKLAQDARVVLADPAKKSQLDARFGIISIEDEPQPAPQPADPKAADPLAGVLPSTDPLAAVLPPTNPLAPVSHVAPVPEPGSLTATPKVPSIDNMSTGKMMPPGVFGAPTTDANVAGPISVAPAAPVIVRPPKKPRRRSSNLTRLVFPAFTLGMLAVIGTLVYFLVWGPGELAITKQDGELKITTKPVDDNRAPQVSQPKPVAQKKRNRRSFDPVMGELAETTPPPTPLNQPSELAIALQSSIPPEVSESAPMVSPAEQPPPDPSPPEIAPPPDTEPGMQPLTNEVTADAEKNLDRVRTLIREAKWNEIKAAAQSMLETRMNEEQQADAKALYELADLATFYRDGIERAVAKLNAGDEVTVNDVPVIVVEKGDDLLVVRFLKKNYSYTFDKIPFGLAHQLATYELPASPTTQAAKAAYQAIAPKATDAHRAEAIAWLREITDEVEGANPKRMADTIESLFGEDA